MKDANAMSEDELNEWFRNVEAVAQEHCLSLADYVAILPSQIETIVARNKRDLEIAVALREAMPDRVRTMAVLNSLTPDERDRLLLTINRLLGK